MKLFLSICILLFGFFAVSAIPTEDATQMKNAASNSSLDSTVANSTIPPPTNNKDLPLLSTNTTDSPLTTTLPPTPENSTLTQPNSTTTEIVSDHDHDHSTTGPCKHSSHFFHGPVVVAPPLSIIDMIETAALVKSLNNAFQFDAPGLEIEMVAPVVDKDSGSPKENIVTTGDLPLGENSTKLPSPPTIVDKDSISKRANIVTIGDLPVGENSTEQVSTGSGEEDGSSEEDESKDLPQPIPPIVNATSSTISKKSIVTTGDKPIGEINVENSAGKENGTVTKVTVQKSTSSVIHSVNSKQPPKEDDENPDTGREERNLDGDAKIKSEVGLHHETLEEIEAKLTKNLNEKLIRKIMEDLIGEDKTDQIMPKNNPSTRTKREVSPHDLPKRTLTKTDVKRMLTAKPGKAPKKFRRVKRGGYSSSIIAGGDNSFNPAPPPSPSGQIPELIVPTLGQRTRMFSSRPQSFVRSPSPVRSTDFKFAVRTRPVARSSPSLRSGSRMRSSGYDAPAIRSSNYDVPAIRSSTYDEPAIRSSTYDEPAIRSSNYDEPAIRSSNYDEPAIRSSSYDEPAIRSSGYDAPPIRSAGYDSQTRSTKFITDLSDLPISRDFPAIRSGYGNDEVRSSPQPAFQTVRVTYEYDTPVVLNPSATRSSSYSDSTRSATRSGGYDAPTRSASYGSTDSRSMSYDDTTMDDEAGERYKRSTTSKKVEKRRVPMVLSTVSRLNRSGSF